MSLANVETAISKLQDGQVVAIPTETVYGLAAVINQPQAIERIFTTKQRPFFDPLIVHVSSIDMARVLTTDWNPLAHILAEKFWPGPLTLVLPKSKQVQDLITSGLESVAIRMPRHPMALEVINKLGVPLAAPSANKFGKTSPTQASHVSDEFKDDQVLVLDGGPCEVGLESTVLLIKRGADAFELAILRTGQVTKTDIEQALKNKMVQYRFVESVSKKESPGHMKHHYMPAIPLVVVEGSLSEDQIRDSLKARLSELPDEVEGVRIVKPTELEKLKELSFSNDPTLAARELYAKMREIAATEAQALYFCRKPFHTGEKWEAFNDRIMKAASLVL